MATTEFLRIGKAENNAKPEGGQQVLNLLAALISTGNRRIGAHPVRLKTGLESSKYRALSRLRTSSLL